MLETLRQNFKFQMAARLIVSIIQTYRSWKPRPTSGRVVNKKFDAKARPTEISVNDLIGHW